MRSEYDRLIKSDQWREIREVIIKRDKSCVICGTTEYLQVHHRKYSSPMINNFFNPDCLTTMCYECHDKVTDMTRRTRYANSRDWPEHNRVDIPIHVTQQPSKKLWPEATYFETPKIENKITERRSLSAC